jgi:hypothetical protein
VVGAVILVPERHAESENKNAVVKRNFQEFFELIVFNLIASLAPNELRIDAAEGDRK